MEWNLLKWPISCIAGISVIAIYCIFTFTSFALFSSPFSPLTHWLSDLGNSMMNYNPQGAIFYNLGCIFTGIVLFPFFAGLNKWYINENRVKAILVATQILGFFSAISLMMIGVFSEEFPQEHQFWGSIFFILTLLILILGNFSFLKHPNFLKPFAYYGFVVAATNLILLIIVFIPLYFPTIEWFTVFSSLSFVGVIVYNTYKLKFTS
ncbi:hypothetical protein ES706_06215 [subsurface metagenome]